MKTNINISNCFSWSRTNTVMNHGIELFALPIQDQKRYNGTPGKIS
jgi:hypothetical protein